MRKIIILILCFSTAFLCFFIPSFADDSVISRTVPTNLTGWTVTVPSNWTAFEGFGLFQLEGTLYYQGGSYPLITTSHEPHNFGIGYSNDGSIYHPIPNYIGIHVLTHAGGGFNILPGRSFMLQITGGDSVESSALINWFVNQGATFESTGSPAYSLPIGNYTYNRTLEDIPNFSFADGVGYSYVFDCRGFYSDGFRYVDFEAISIDVIRLDSSSIWTANVEVYTGSEYIPIYRVEIYNSDRNIIPLNDFEYLHFNEPLIADEDSIDFFADTLVVYNYSAEDSNVWANILTQIVEALKVKIFGYFSIWDILTTLCGISLLVWFLKMLAGG